MGASDASNEGGLETAEDDKLIKKTLLTDTITTKCASSPHNILQQIDHAINKSGDDSKLEATVLSGGYTNYSYKVFVDNHPELCVFAKLCFEYALWNPDKTAHYDLNRTESEYEIMKTAASIAPDCVVTPLACWDVKHDGQHMKLLVTDWSEGDEQLSNQFCDGIVDPRVAPQIADTLAKLHNIKEFDPDFNELVKPCMLNLFEQMKHIAQEASNTTNPKDRTEAYCASLGEDIVMKIIEANIANYHQRDCLLHSDSHAFNTLVEAKPSIEELETFGPKGTVVLCDWEMSMAGPQGRDIGLALSFPVGCLIAHALNGQSEANESIEVFINTIIDTYLSRMEEAGKTPEEIAALLRNIAGWCGWFQYLGCYILGMVESYPVESDETVGRHRDALGTLGFKFLRLSYDTDYLAASASTEEVRKIFNSLWEEEVTRAQDVFAAGKQRRRPRKSSIFRIANRRQSDTEMLYLAAESVKRLSVSKE